MASENRWFMPTNTDNLRMIIAQGLISSPIGFKKYYKDTLDIFPGYIVLFKNEIQPNILKYVSNEVEDMSVCILEFDFDSIIGIFKTIIEGELVDCTREDIQNNEVDIVLILAPLPLSCISHVLFSETTEKKSFEADAGLYSNVPLKSFNRSFFKIEAPLFKTKATISDYSIDSFKNIDLLEVPNLDYNKIYAFGGLMANLFYNAKNGNMSNKALLACSSLEKTNNENDYALMLNYFHNFNDNTIEDNINQKLYNGLLDIAVNRKDFKEGIIEFLESDTRTASIANKLKTFESMSDKPISEEFEEATTLFGKTLLMLFIREDSESLMDYYLEQFEEEDYIMFYMIFGIRDKFIKIPKFLREYNGLQFFISSKMAEFSHKQINSNIKFVKSEIPLTIVDMLDGVNTAPTTFVEFENKKNFKNWLIKIPEIELFFQTVMPNKEYSSRSGINSYKGYVELSYKVIEDEYFKSISKKKITEEEYNKFRKMKK